MAEDEKINELTESLSPIERNVLPFLKDNDFEEIIKKTKMDSAGVLRALEFLSNKNLLALNITKEQIIDLEVNGILYLKRGLPERRLINLVSERNSVSLSRAQKLSGLNDNEFKAAIGALKKKAFINIVNENIILSGKKQDIAEKTLEEKFLERLPKDYGELLPEEKYALENLKARKNIIIVKNKQIIGFSLTGLGDKILKQNLKESEDLIEAVTPELLKTSRWKGKKFRRYDIKSPVPRIFGGKKHFVNQATDYAKKTWIEMGFKEMTGDLTESSFWVFDALFTPQDHPAREMQDTFFIKDKIAKLPEKKLVNDIKKAHEGEIKGSKGWNYKWREEDAKKVLLRTHTTSISARTLMKIAEKKEFPAKYFALGKCFRNETIDATHGFEFNQTEGIVVDENANFRQLLGYLVEFFRKMGYEKIRIRPSYFAYTEPSLEIDVFHPIFKKWVELGGAGMFRPEITIPFFGKHIPVLAWGPGIDRIFMEFFNINDFRDIYGNDINKLRNMKIWGR